MDKIVKFISGIIVSTIILCTVAAASSPTSVTLKSQVNQTLTSEHTIDNIAQIREIHKRILKQRLATLNSDGTISVTTNATSLGVDDKEFQDYLQSVNNLNDIIKSGVVSINKNFKIKALPRDKVTNIVYQRDKQLQLNATLNRNKFDEQYMDSTYTKFSYASSSSYITLTHNTSALPTLNAFSIAD